MPGEPADLRAARKTDERRVRSAGHIRKESTMSLKWIAENLAMGGIACDQDLA